jgi:hypothetical protein
LKRTLKRALDFVTCFSLNQLLLNAMFAAATLKFGVMKTKLLAQVVEPNGSAPTNQPPA